MKDEKLNTYCHKFLPEQTKSKCLAEIRAKYGKEPKGITFWFSRKHEDVSICWNEGDVEAEKYKEHVWSVLEPERRKAVPKPEFDMNKNMQEFQKFKDFVIKNRPSNSIFDNPYSNTGNSQEIKTILRDIKYFLVELECNYFDDDDLSDYDTRTGKLTVFSRGCQDKKMKKKLNEIFDKLKRLSETLG